MVFVCAVVGSALHEAEAAVGRLAGVSLPHALQLPGQAELQPGGWLGKRWRCYHDAATDTLWLAVAAGPAPDGSAPPLSPDDLREREAAATRALLAAFLASHAVLWLQPPAPPAAAAHALLPRATELLARLRLLQQLKGAVMPALPELLGLGAGGASAAAPGLCVPQLLVAAQVQPAAAGATAAAASTAAADGLQERQLAAAEAAAERQLRRLLKHCRVLLPPDNARALCALPTAGPLVLRLDEHLGCGGDQEQLVVAALADLPLPLQPGQQQQQQQPPAGRPPPAAAVAAALAPQRAAVAGMAQRGGAAAADVPSWRRAVASLAAVLEAAALRQPAPAADGDAGTPSGDVAVPAAASAAAAWQEACTDGVRQFSLASCKRAAATASDAYRRNTPALLPAPGHAAALAAAVRLYRSLARGPAAAAGEAALRQQLTDYWRAGHQQCDAVSFLGNACCLPAHDPQQQPHSSSGRPGERPLLLLASGSGAQQLRIAEPFTVAELQQAAVALAAESASAAARAQFYVRRLSATGEALPAAEEEEEAAEDAAAARGHLSGTGHSSDDEAAAAAAPTAAGAAAASAAARAAGSPAAGCWLELHVLGPRSMYRSAALSAALLMDGQPGWLRAGGCMFAVLPLLVSVPGRAGQPQQEQPAGEPRLGAAEEFPSLEAVKQQAQQRRRPAAARAGPSQKQRKGVAAAAEAAPQQPRLLNWPAAADAADAPVNAPQGAGGSRQLGPGGRPQPGRGGRQQPTAATAVAAAAAAAGAEQATVLLGAEYESVAGQRLLLTPALLAAAVQSSLDPVSVRQQAAPAAAPLPSPGPHTAAAAAAAGQVQAPGAAAFLLHHDLPLWLQLPGEQLEKLAGGKRRSAPGGVPSGGERPALVWLQLRRLLVATPEVAVPLEAAPQLLLEVPAEMLLPAGGAAPTGAAAPGATVQLRYGLAGPLALPPASFCVLALPWQLTAPMSGGSGTALVRCLGPLRAVLSAQTAVRPAGEPAA